MAQFILKVAFSEPSDASNPVLQSVFALASLQLHGSLKSFRYKHLAVASVVEETIDWLDEKTLLQKLMAAMLLYHYEVGPPNLQKLLPLLANGYSSHLGQIRKGAGYLFSAQ